MRRFLAQMALFWLIQGGILSALYWVYLCRTDEYLAASRDKERRLASLSGQRVVFVGGSNLAFGLDSAVIERHTDRRSVNMGLFMCLGVPFMLDEARAGLRPGDVVVVALEYGLYTVDTLTLNETVDWAALFQVNPFAARYAPRHAFRSLGQWTRKWADTAGQGDGLVPFGRVIHDILGQQQVENAYARHHFNEAGDHALFRERTPDLRPLGLPAVASDSGAAVRAQVAAQLETAQTAAQLEDFTLECRRRGIAVYLAMPVYPRPHYDSQAAILEEIQAVLRRRVSAPILVAGREATLPVDRFYDSPYHLTTRGAAERSDLLGRRLAQALGRPAQTSEALLRHHGRGVRPPQRSEYGPEPAFLDWHGREVFKGQAKRPESQKEGAAGDHAMGE